MVRIVLFYKLERRKRKKMKRGFELKREALDWEREFVQLKNSDLSMSFNSFVKIYMDDMKDRIREHTFARCLAMNRLTAF